MRATHWRMFSRLQNDGALNSGKKCIFRCHKFQFSDKTNKQKLLFLLLFGCDAAMAIPLIQLILFANIRDWESWVGATFYSNSDIKFRTVFNSFNRILMSVLPILILCVVSFGTPSTSSLSKLNVMVAQSMASFGISNDTSVNLFAGIIVIDTANFIENVNISTESDWISPVKLVSSKCWLMRLLLSLNTRHIAVECSFGRPSCCNSADKVASSVWYRVAFIKMKRMQEMVDFTDFKSFLFAANDSLSFSS